MHYVHNIKARRGKKRNKFVWQHKIKLLTNHAYMHIFVHAYMEITAEKIKERFADLNLEETRLVHWKSYFEEQCHRCELACDVIARCDR